MPFGAGIPGVAPSVISSRGGAMVVVAGSRLLSERDSSDDQVVFRR